MVSSGSFDGKRITYFPSNGHYIWRIGGFYDYYQIYQGRDDHNTKSGSEDQEELVPIGMHSPWGRIEALMAQKGWTMQYVLEGISWLNLQMLTADKVQLVKRKDQVIKVPKEGLKQQRERLNNGR